MLVDANGLTAPQILKLDGLMRKYILLILLISLFGCSLLNTSKREIRNSEQAWAASGVKNYNYTFIVASLGRDNECSTPRIGIEVEVRNGSLTKFGTCELNVEKAYKFGTVEKIFETLRNEKSNYPPGLQVRCNKKYGYPEYIDINYSRWVTDARVHIMFLTLRS